MPRFRMDARKYPDLLHWQYELLYLGEDEHGLWLHLPSGTLARRGNAPMRPIVPGFVALVPVADPWVIEFYVNHPQYLVYVNIGSVPVVEDAVVHQIDLDLDVVLTHDRLVAVLDEDESGVVSEKTVASADGGQASTLRPCRRTRW